MAERDIYIAIMVAAAHGRGLHLSADETATLSLDVAIYHAALNGLGDGERDDWRNIDPYRTREPANAMV